MASPRAPWREGRLNSFPLEKRKTFCIVNFRATVVRQFVSLLLVALSSSSSSSSYSCSLGSNCRWLNCFGQYYYSKPRDWLSGQFWCKIRCIYIMQTHRKFWFASIQPSLTGWQWQGQTFFFFLLAGVPRFYTGHCQRVRWMKNGSFWK